MGSNKRMAFGLSLLQTGYPEMHRAVLAVGSDLRRRYKCPSVTIRVSNECFGAKIVLFWLLNNPVASLASFFDHSGSVADVEMGIHAKPELFAVTARFFPAPSTVPEEDAEVIRLQHHEPVALGFEAKTNEIAIERNRSSEVRNLQQDVIDLWCAVAGDSGSSPKTVRGATGMQIA
jgi:hypothetical protein